MGHGKDVPVSDIHGNKSSVVGFEASKTPVQGGNSSPPDSGQLKQIKRRNAVRISGTRRVSDAQDPETKPPVPEKPPELGPKPPLLPVDKDSHIRSSTPQPRANPHPKPVVSKKTSSKPLLPPAGAKPGQNPLLPPKSATPGPNPLLPPKSINSGQNPSLPPKSTIPGQNPPLPPKSTIPGHNPSLPPKSINSGQNPSLPPKGMSPDRKPSLPPKGTNVDHKHPLPQRKPHLPSTPSNNKLETIIRPSLPPLITDPKLKVSKKKTVRFGPESILQQVVSDGELEELKELVSRQGSPIINNRDSNGEPMIIRAITYKQLEVVQYLISLGVDMTLTNDSGWTALHAAVVMDDKEYTKAILKTGDPVLTTIRSLNNLRPMDIARSMDTAKLLLHADLEALESQVKETVDGPSSNNRVNLGLIGCSDEETSLISCLLSKNAEDGKRFCRAKEKHMDYSLLHYAVIKNYVKLGFVLLKRHLVDIDSRDIFQQTPLHYAARKANSDMILLLKHFGADSACTDTKGHTPAFLATPFHCTWLST